MLYHLPKSLAKYIVWCTNTLLGLYYVIVVGRNHTSVIRTTFRVMRTRAVSCSNPCTMTRHGCCVVTVGFTKRHHDTIACHGKCFG